jgi:arsenate reductase (glutaredoxin)
MTKLFGIPNCDTVRKARQFLETNDVEFEFHDFRKDGVTEKMIEQWLEHLEWKDLLNKRSTSFRQLSEEQKLMLTEHKSFQLLKDNPTLIKRPIFEFGKSVINGFKPEQYIQMLEQ